MDTNYLKAKGLISDCVFQELIEVADKYQIDTALRLSHFLAQCAHESGNFEHFVENLNYSAVRLCQVFPKYFYNDLAERFAHRPIRIASRVYANRMGNGDEDSGDGWTFRGRGFIQLTGRDNYKLFDATVPEDILKNPDLVATKYPLLSAAWFWNKNSLNKIADMGDTEKVLIDMTRRVNGGLNGLKERTNKFHYFYAFLK